MSEHRSTPTREERLAIALDYGDVGIWEWNVVTGKVIWTETLERLHGFEPGAFGGTFDVYASYIHEEDRERLFATIDRVFQERVPYEVEYRMYRPDGSLHWVQARGRLFTDENDQPHIMMGICMDVTARRRAVDGLQLLSEASRVLGSSLVTESTLPLVARLCVPHLGDWCVVDLAGEDGTIRRVALAHRDPQKEELAHDVDSRYPSMQDAQAGPAHVIRTGATEFVADIPLELLRANAQSDEHFRLLMQLGMRSYICAPLAVRDRVLGAVTVVNAESRRPHDGHDLQLLRELCDRAALAIDNARLYEKSVDASRAKDEFLAMLSHELRTPLTSVLGYASLLEVGGLTEDETHSALESIKSSARAQARLVEDLLEVSRQVMGKVQLDPVALDLVSTVRTAIDAISPIAHAKKLELRVANEVQRCVVSGDSARLQQVLVNLLSNAVKFTPEGGRIDVGLTTDESDAVLTVRDSGDGIAPDLLPHVFERFRQGATSLQHGGLGLGLSIVRHLVEMHGGSIVAQSDGVGTGAMFTIRLPRPAEATSPRGATTAQPNA